MCWSFHWFGRGLRNYFIGVLSFCSLFYTCGAESGKVKSFDQEFVRTNIKGQSNEYRFQCSMNNMQLCDAQLCEACSLAVIVYCLWQYQLCEFVTSQLYFISFANSKQQTRCICLPIENWISNAETWSIQLFSSARLVASQLYFIAFGNTQLWEACSLAVIVYCLWQ